MCEFENALAPMPETITKIIEERCPYCGTMHRKQVKYELKITVSLYTTEKCASKRYKIFYETRDISQGDRNKYIGDPTGLGHRTLIDALNELKGYLQ